MANIICVYMRQLNIANRIVPCARIQQCVLKNEMRYDLDPS